MCVRVKVNDEEVVKEWNSLIKKHKKEKAALIVRFAVGRSMQQIADLLGYSQKWVANMIDCHAIYKVVHNLQNCNTGLLDLTFSSQGVNASDELKKVLTKYAPDEISEKQIREYEDMGHTEYVARRLARTEFATEAAIKDGAIGINASDKVVVQPSLEKSITEDETLRRDDSCLNCEEKKLKVYIREKRGAYINELTEWLFKEYLEKEGEITPGINRMVQLSSELRDLLMEGLQSRMGKTLQSVRRKGYVLCGVNEKWLCVEHATQEDKLASSERGHNSIKGSVKNLNKTNQENDIYDPEINEVDHVLNQELVLVGLK